MFVICYTEVLDENYTEDIYSFGRTKLKYIMYGEFDGGVKLTDEERNNKLKFEEKHFGEQ